MNKTHTKKKLTLHRESLRILERPDLLGVAGGQRNPTISCDPTMCCPSNVKFCPVNG